MIALLVLAPAAIARRAPTRTERAAIAATIGVPARCVTIWVATKGPGRYASLWRREHATRCSAFAGDGVVVLRRRDGVWRSVFENAGYDCPVDGIPLAVQRDLRVC